MTDKTRKALNCLRNESLKRAKQMVAKGWEVIKMTDNSITWQLGTKRFIDLFILYK